MTLDHAVATLQALRSDKYAEAAVHRRLGDEYKEAANAADNSDLRSQQFRQSSSCYGMANRLNQEATAIDMVLEAMHTGVR